MKRASGDGRELCSSRREGFLKTVEDLLCILPFGARRGGGDEVLKENEAHFAYSYASEGSKACTERAEEKIQR